jgi:hypothetical protein
MWVLQFFFVLFVLGIVNCFQFATALLAKQTGRDFWFWFCIALFMPGISLIFLLFTWDGKETSRPIENH